MKEGNLMYYNNLHTHSDYSNLRLIDSINRIEDLIDYAKELGMHAIALTDHDSISGHLRAMEYFESKYKDDPDFKLILGNEIYLAREGLNESNFEKGEPFYHLLLLAKDEVGHKQLRELSSRAWTRGFFRNIMRVFNYPSDLFEIIGANPGHLVCSTACLGGYTAHKFRENDFERVDNFLNMMRDLMGKENFYIELQPSDTEEQIAYNKYMLEKYWHKFPFIFTTDAHYLKAEDQDIHRIFLNSKSSGEREVDEFYSSAYLMSYQEINRFFDYIGPHEIEEMAQNTIKIADMCTTYSLIKSQIVTKIAYEEIEDHRRIFNDFDLNKYPNIKHFMLSDYQADIFFMKLLAYGWYNEKIAAKRHDVYLSRLDQELEAIKEISKALGLPMTDYFNSMWKMIDIIWNEADSLVGPSRGSAGAFLVNYLLGITQMNPLEQELELPYWRFMNKDRVSLPDIDIDTEASKRVKVFNKVQSYFRSIGGDLVNICTFGTEGSKSALRTAARGLGIDQDVITYLVSMIPNERGFDWTLHECYFGNEDHGRIEKFVEEIDKYEFLWAVASKIEGLITRLGVHASGVVAVNEPFTERNSLMKTSKEVVVSAFDLHDSEKLGLIKYDFLTISALDRIRQTINYLLEDSVINWQGSLKATYDKYLHPKVLDYTNETMWDMVAEGKINSLFQFDTIVGSQAIRQIKPRSLKELSIANSVMRLMSDGELPLETYAKYKHNINLWYTELTMNGLIEPEVKVLEKHLLKLSGVADSQESIMMLSMDPEITNFTMMEADLLRKTVAKKQFDKIEEMRQLFMKKGFDNGAGINLLKYIWEIQIKRQLGYSFSAIHTTGYSILAVQEMNLAYHYPTIYWNCACLSADSSAINEEDFYNLMDEGIVEISDEEDLRKQNKTDYAKVANAIDRFKRVMDIRLPDINNSRLGFTPDVDNNCIVYGLKGITRITGPVIQEIMSKRPYVSLQDFVTKITRRIVTKDKIVNLIKSGAFDRIEGKTKREILEDFIKTTCDQKKRLTLQNLNMLFNYNLLPEHFTPQKEIYKFTKTLRGNRDSNKFYYILTDDLDRSLLGNTEIKVITLPENDRTVEVIDSAKWDAHVYTPEMNKIKIYITKNHDILLEQLNKILFMEEWNKYASGDELQWELDSLNLYYSGHPLTGMELSIPVMTTQLQNVEENKIDGFFLIKGKEIPRMYLYSIFGTVLDKNTTKGIVTLQTPDGIIDVKIYKDLFALYNHSYAAIVNGEVFEENSFFDKGTHLLITGIKRGETFIPKTYRNTRLKPILRIALNKEGQFVALFEKTVADTVYAS